MANPRICSIDGCDKPFKAKGLCGAHYWRLRQHGDPITGDPITERTPEGQAQRFYEEIVLPYEGHECLLWPYMRNSDGYGRMKVDGKPVNVHRRLCEETAGSPPTPKHHAAHSCGRGYEGCVTKRHLSWKTPKENQADRLIHGTHNRGERNGRATITELEAREILSLKDKQTQMATARRLGISQSTVSAIQTGQSWSWLSGDMGKDDR